MVVTFNGEVWMARIITPGVRVWMAGKTRLEAIDKCLKRYAELSFIK